VVEDSACETGLPNRCNKRITADPREKGADHPCITKVHITTLEEVLGRQLTDGGIVIDHAG
jgi:hypothetical protein